jgi:hypothetical protein
MQSSVIDMRDRRDAEISFDFTNQLISTSDSALVRFCVSRLQEQLTDGW